MTLGLSFLARGNPAGRVVALHCSGADGSQWTTLSAALGRDYDLATPEHYGCASRGPWSGEHTFTLADEARAALALIDQFRTKVHLVGHSYGGGLALHIALARPSRVASVSVYEPSSFHLLREMGEPGSEAFAEISDVARRVSEGIMTGNHRSAVAGFVDYWNGPGAWETLPPARQQALIRWVSKAPLDFHALFSEQTPLHAYRTLDVPVLVMCGDRTTLPGRVVAENLSQLLPDSRLVVVNGAGHMGPMTHASDVAALVAQHISLADHASRFKLQRRAPRKMSDVLSAASSSR
jgi:pimeloyl-ACP methyl ester carboxylesterase